MNALYFPYVNITEYDRIKNKHQIISMNFK
jgi:hypothetical protein